MGTQWHYKPTHEIYKSGTELIEILIETRAKGGNLLLNVGPKPDGELPIEQEERLREIALWNFVNGGGDRRRAPLGGHQRGRRLVHEEEGRGHRLRVPHPNVPGRSASGRASPCARCAPTADTQGERAGRRPARCSSTGPTWIPGRSGRQDGEGLHLDVMMAQRLYNDRKWPNPLVVEAHERRARAAAAGRGHPCRDARARARPRRRCAASSGPGPGRRRSRSASSTGAASGRRGALHAGRRPGSRPPLVARSAKGAFSAEIDGPRAGAEPTSSARWSSTRCSRPTGKSSSSRRRRPRAD